MVRQRFFPLQGCYESEQAGTLDNVHDLRRICGRHPREKISAGRADERGALELCRINICGDVAIGVDVAVRLIVHIDRWDAERPLFVDVVIAAHAVLDHLRVQRLLAALRINERIERLAGSGVLLGFLIYELTERGADVVDK